MARTKNEEVEATFNDDGSYREFLETSMLWPTKYKVADFFIQVGGKACFPRNGVWRLCLGHLIGKPHGHAGIQSSLEVQQVNRAANSSHPGG